MEQWTVLLVGALSIATVATVISQMKLWVEVKAMQRSTHQLTVLHPNGKAPEFESLTDEARAMFEKAAFDNIS